MVPAAVLHLPEEPAQGPPAVLHLRGTPEALRHPGISARDNRRRSAIWIYVRCVARGTPLSISGGGLSLWLWSINRSRLAPQGGPL